MISSRSYFSQVICDFIRAMKQTDKMKVRDIHPFGVRMPSELKERIDREAKINGRSLNTEIVIRLRGSLDEAALSLGKAYVAGQQQAGYALELNDIERQLLNVFRRMPVDKQLALLSLFK
jgi:hypothetical protein